MMDLMQNFPRSENGFVVARKALISRMSTERIIKEGILFNYESAKKLGLDYDQRKNIYDGIQKLTLEDVASFHNRMIADKKYNVLVVGDRKRLDLKSLNSYGKVQELTTDELFGFKKAPKVSAGIIR